MKTLRPKNGKYPLYRNEVGVGIRKYTCGCQDVFGKDGRYTSFLCRGHGGGRMEGPHKLDLSQLPAFDEVAEEC